MHDEHVIARVHADADHVAEHPVVGQRLGPQRIDLEARRRDVVNAGACASSARCPTPSAPIADDERGDAQRRSRCASWLRAPDLAAARGHAAACVRPSPAPSPLYVNFCTRLPS